MFLWNLQSVIDFLLPGRASLARPAVDGSPFLADIVAPVGSTSTIVARYDPEEATMGDPLKKLLKAEAKRAKKLAKAEIKATPSRPSTPPAERQPSAGVRYAESVRGILYVILAVSLIVALLLGQQGAILSLDDIVESLFAAWAGKVILALIALALLIYGLKHLRLVR
jgi:hypothetical protein